MTLLAFQIDLTLSEWGTLLLVIAAGLGLLGIAWRVFKRLSRGIYLIETYGPILIGIAKQFETNGGVSLKDQINRIEKAAADAKGVAKEAHDTAAAAKEAIIRVEGIMIGRAIPPRTVELKPTA